MSYVTRAQAYSDGTTYAVWVEFEDGLSGFFDMQPMIEVGGIFAPLRNAAEFVKVYVDQEMATIAWPNGADVDPYLIHDEIQTQQTAQKINAPEFAQACHSREARFEAPQTTTSSWFVGAAPRSCWPELTKKAA